MFESLLDVLFPKRCAGCGGGAWPFCERCRAELTPLGRPRCERCGAPSARALAACRHCPPESIASARSAFLFDGPARTAVHRLKFSGWRGVAEALGAAMAASFDLQADGVTWVPLSRRRRSARGFDQAQALARVVGTRLDLPCGPLLRRVLDPGSQARRGGRDRRRAMRGAFAVAGRPPARVLLVDDVLTTGATAAACAEPLLAAGARSVCLLTAARAASGVPDRRSAPILGDGLASGSVVARGTSLR